MFEKLQSVDVLIVIAKAMHGKKEIKKEEEEERKYVLTMASYAC